MVWPMPINSKLDKAQTIKDISEINESDVLWTIDSFYTYINYANQLIAMDRNILSDFDDIFYQYLEEYYVDNKYFYKPNLLARDLYGTSELDFLILYFSNIPSYTEFNKSKIKYLPLNYLPFVNQILMNNKESVKESHENPKLII